MSNPFKTKKLNDFTIEDCETYLDEYPYGEHEFEVKKRLKRLKNDNIEPPHIIEEETVYQSLEPETLEDCDITLEDDDTLSVQETTDNQENSEPEKSVVSTILYWIGLIVVVLVVGTIIVFVLDAILPESADVIVKKYRVFIYFSCAAVAKWIEENK